MREKKVGKREGGQANESSYRHKISFASWPSLALQEAPVPKTIKFSL